MSKIDSTIQALLEAMAAQQKAADQRIEALLQRLAAQQRLNSQRCQPAYCTKTLPNVWKSSFTAQRITRRSSIDMRDMKQSSRRTAIVMDDQTKVSLLTEKLSTSDFDKFANTILPRTKANIPFNDAVTPRLFPSRKESQFVLRYKCLKVKELRITQSTRLASILSARSSQTAPLMT